MKEGFSYRDSVLAAGLAMQKFPMSDPTYWEAREFLMPELPGLVKKVGVEMTEAILEMAYYKHDTAFDDHELECVGNCAQKLMEFKGKKPQTQREAPMSLVRFLKTIKSPSPLQGKFWEVLYGKVDELAKVEGFGKTAAAGLALQCYELSRDEAQRAKSGGRNISKLLGRKGEMTVAQAHPVVQNALRDKGLINAIKSILEQSN